MLTAGAASLNCRHVLEACACSPRASQSSRTEHLNTHVKGQLVERAATTVRQSKWSGRTQRAILEAYRLQRTHTAAAPACLSLGSKVQLYRHMHPLIQLPESSVTVSRRSLCFLVLVVRSCQRRLVSCSFIVDEYGIQQPPSVRMTVDKRKITLHSSTPRTRIHAHEYEMRPSSPRG